MIFRVKELELTLSISEGLLKNLIKIGQAHYPNEFGGILIGSYTENFKHLSVTDTILPTTYKSTKFHFERGIEDVENELKLYYSVDPPKYYVGEWHTHPHHLPIPSYTDINALNEIIECATVSIKHPVLLIIGQDKGEISSIFYVIYNQKLYKYE